MQKHSAGCHAVIISSDRLQHQQQQGREVLPRVTRTRREREDESLAPKLPISVNFFRCDRKTLNSTAPLVFDRARHSARRHRRTHARTHRSAYRSVSRLRLRRYNESYWITRTIAFVSLLPSDQTFVVTEKDILLVLVRSAEALEVQWFTKRRAELGEVFAVSFRGTHQRKCPRPAPRRRSHGASPAWLVLPCPGDGPRDASSRAAAKSPSCVASRCVQRRLC